MALDYSTTTPEMNATVEMAAAATAGNYASFQVPMHGSIVPVQAEGSDGQYQQVEGFCLGHGKYDLFCLGHGKWMMDEFVAAGISKKLGIIGFYFGGGRLIDVLTQDGGACFGIGVSFYGTRIDPSVVANIKVPVLFIVGDNDPSCLVSALVYDFLNVNFDVDVDVLYFRKY